PLLHGEMILKAVRSGGGGLERGRLLEKCALREQPAKASRLAGRERVGIERRRQTDSPKSPGSDQLNLHSDLNPDGGPSLPDRLLLKASPAVELLRYQGGKARGIFKLRAGPELVSQRHVPDLAGLFPGVPADPDGDLVKSPVRNPGVDVNPAVVLGCFHIVLHMSGLGVFSENRIVIGRAGLFHRPKRLALDPLRKEPLPDQPVRLLDVLFL